MSIKEYFIPGDRSIIRFLDIKNQENFDKFEYPLWGDNYKGLKTTISNEQFKKPGILILEMERHGRCIIESSNV